MKKNDGVTLVVLIITIIVLLIVAVISINYGFSTLNGVADSKNEIELTTVQQAVVQQYTLLISENKDQIIATAISRNLKITSDPERPDLLVGSRIGEPSTVLEFYGFSDYKKTYSSGATDLFYEDYYYLLEEDDLETLGISKDTSSTDSGERSYIVNYSTGEVFDIVNETYRISDDEIYLNGTGSNTAIQEYDFNDD